MTALQVAEKIKNKEITSMDAVESVAKAVEQRDATYNCYVSFDKDEALQQAELVQKRIDAGETTSLFAGVPIAIKDNICEKGKLTSCSSKILSNFRPPYNATVINKLVDVIGQLVFKRRLKSCFLCEHNRVPTRNADVYTSAAGATLIYIIHYFG